MFQERMVEFIEDKNQFSNNGNRITDLIELGFLDYLKSGEIPFQLLENLALQDLMFYVETSHKFYLEKKLPEISQSILSLSKSFGQSHPSTLIMSHFFHKYYAHLKEHIELEEVKIMPYVKTLIEIENGALENLALLKVCDRYLLSKFHENHSDTEMDIKIVRRTLLEFKAPPSAESQFRLLIQQLKAFEKDLHFHSELEEKVMIPKALNLEKVIRG